jgi:unsaturated rhamnogalacturonyl hydrolase
MTPLEYAKRSIETMMRRYRAEDLPPKGRFHYHQGVFLSGVYQNYLLCGDERYFEYIKTWVDSCIDASGALKDADMRQMDDIQPGILLFPLYERTGDERYKALLDVLTKVIIDSPKNPDGGLYHKAWYERQMWLDGLYMGGPILAQYGAEYGKPEYLDFVIKQVKLMREHTRDEKTGLWYHGYDDAKVQPWADKGTGRSHEFWGRSMGWVPVAILDDLDYIPETHPDRETLKSIVKDLLEAICRFQSDDGRWYQVVDKGDRSDNWLENSCSCLFAAALARAVNNGILDESYMTAARRAFEAVTASLGTDGQDIVVGQVCVGTSVGDYDYYVNRPVSENDLHGVGAFLLMCAAMETLDK